MRKRMEYEKNYVIDEESSEDIFGPKDLKILLKHYELAAKEIFFST